MLTSDDHLLLLVTSLYSFSEVCIRVSGFKPKSFAMSVGL